ncbi:MAG: PEP-CTERM system histidine kinase PrsK [Gammaproteobacteria bacterium]|nr:PEP-CTERM system histidine kinase PrsK [Gammaproteobacteria bacterium]
MTTIAGIAGYIGAIAFLALFGLLTVAARSKPVGRRLMAACAASVLWFGVQAVIYQFQARSGLSADLVLQLEFVRNLAWVVFFSGLLLNLGDAAYRHTIKFGATVLAVACAFGITLPELLDRVLFGVEFDQLLVRKWFFCTALLVVLGVLVLIEQVFRNTSRDSRWALKHLCFGLGFVFAYDFYLYADAVLFNRLDSVLMSARGVVNALAVPMVAISVVRNRQWDIKIFVSRRVVFHVVVLIAAGLYLILMSAAGYYIQAIGGEWGRALTTTFFSAAILLLLTLIFSTQLRSRIRLFLATHFYRNKYEYGEEWLKFTQALARTTLEPDSLNETILTAVCDIVDSPGGILWHKTGSGSFAIAARYSMYGDRHEEFAADDPMLVGMARDPQICDLSDEAQLEGGRLRHAPQWLLDMSRIALLVPIVHGDEMLAILALSTSRTNQRFDAEDFNLLGTVARQAASYLALVRATDALSEARQFETFNRLSAFLVHDLKNVVAQLSLIGSNARRHRHNPEFIEDAFNTVDDATAKMKRMLASLRQRQSEVESDEVVELGALLATAVASKAEARPCPVFARPAEALPVRASRDHLQSVVQHLLQNAIEATDADGQVEVRVERHASEVRATITDTGCGMDRDFIHNRLFRPFDTTKGKAGMGIGAYESRHLISSMRGELLVESEPGRGTTFTIVLPLAENQEHPEARIATGH